MKTKDGKDNCPEADDIYSTEELRNIVGEGLISHYKGFYDENQKWDDDSGNAYAIKYSAGKIHEIYKGTFFENSYGSGWLIRENDDGNYSYAVGSFHDENGIEIKDKLKISTLEESEFFILIHGEDFEN